MLFVSGCRLGLGRPGPLPPPYSSLRRSPSCCAARVSFVSGSRCCIVHCWPLFACARCLRSAVGSTCQAVGTWAHFTSPFPLSYSAPSPSSSAAVLCLPLPLAPAACWFNLFPACSLLNAYCSLQISAPRFVCSVCLSLTLASGALWLYVACGPFADPLDSLWPGAGLPGLAGCWLLAGRSSLAAAAGCSGPCCLLLALALWWWWGHGSPSLAPLSLFCRLRFSFFFSAPSISFSHFCVS